MTGPSAEKDEPRCAGCGYTKYGHVMAIERMVASAHEWEPRDLPPGGSSTDDL